MNIFILLAIGFVGRLLVSPFGTLNLDQGTFVAWSHMLTQGGLQTFYNSWSDYLPGYLYILALLGHISQVLGNSSPVLYKLPAICVDIATGLLIYKIVLEIKNKKLALIAAGAYIFNPAIFANSTLWGQVDTFTAFFALLAVYTFRRNIYMSAIALAIGTLVKPQAALAGLPILFVFLKTRKKPVEYISYAIVGLVTFALGFLPFTTLTNLPGFIIERLSATTSQYPYTSINAFNFWGLWDFWQPDTTGSQVFGFAAILMIFVFIARKLWNSKHAEYPLLAMSLLSGFLFMTRLHERHLLPALAPIIVTTSLYPLAVVSYCLLSSVYLLNLRYAFVWINENFRSIFSPFLIKAMIVTNIVSLGIFVSALFHKVSPERWAKKIVNRMPEKSHTKLKDSVDLKRARVILYCIIACAFVSRILFLDTPANEYFDEVYHAFTARTMLHDDPKAWEWWNPNPEGFAYEWTHPPLAKLGMVVGMTIFGENSLGWRIPGAFLGTISVLLIYLIATELFKNRELGLFAAGVYALDGLALTTSRIGMNDTYFLFFILLCFYLFLKDKHFFASIALGLAASSKWSTMWFLPILLTAFFALRKKWTKQYILYALVPVIMYLGSYIPFFIAGHTTDQFVELQKQMWWYHTGLKAEHSYSSPWWSWPLLLRPVWAYVNYATDTTIGNIYLMGNPAVFWFGAASVILAGYEAFLERNKKLGLILFAFFAFFASWALSPRIMFLYHFLPSIPFLAIASAYVLKRNPKIVVPFFVIAGILFLYFYPHWIGMTIPKWLDSSYYWLPSWK